MNSAVGEQFFGAVARGKGPRWMARLDQPHALSFLPDIAAGLVTLGEHPEADGEAWHLPVSPALTGAGVVGADGRDRRSRRAAVDRHPADARGPRPLHAAAA